MNKRKKLEWIENLKGWMNEWISMIKMKNEWMNKYLR